MSRQWPIDLTLCVLVCGCTVGYLIAGHVVELVMRDDAINRLANFCYVFQTPTALEPSDN